MKFSKIELYRDLKNWWGVYEQTRRYVHVLCWLIDLIDWSRNVPKMQH